jgi:hypothetical protein
MVWATPGNWTPNQVPVAGDTASFTTTAASDITAPGASVGHLNFLTTGATAYPLDIRVASANTFTFDTNSAGITESVVTASKVPFDSFFKNSGLTFNNNGPGALAIGLNNDLRFRNTTGYHGSVWIQNSSISSSSPRTITVESVDSTKIMGLRLEYSTSAGAANAFSGTYVVKGNGFSTVGGVTTTTFTQPAFNSSTACTNARIFCRLGDGFGPASNTHGVVLKGGTLDVYAGTQATISTTWARDIAGTGVIECRDGAGTPLTFTKGINIGVSSIIPGAPDEINFFRGGAGVSVAAATLNVDAAVGLLTPGTYTILQQLDNFTFTGSTFAAMNLPSNVMVQPVLNGTGGVTAFQLVISQVPEPGMASIIGMGLLFAGYRRRRTG